MAVKLTESASDRILVSWPAALIRQLRRIFITALLIGFAGATLVRLGPGFGVDERELDARLNQQSREAIHAERSSERNILAFYITYLGRLLRGDLGFSHSLNRPVTELLVERLPLTLESLGYGAGAGLLLGFLLAAATTLWRTAAHDIAGGLLAGICVSIPSAVMALF